LQKNCRKLLRSSDKRKSNHATSRLWVRRPTVVKQPTHPRYSTLC